MYSGKKTFRCRENLWRMIPSLIWIVQYRIVFHLMFACGSDFFTQSRMMQISWQELPVTTVHESHISVKKLRNFRFKYICLLDLNDKNDQSMWFVRLTTKDSSSSIRYLTGSYGSFRFYQFHLISTNQGVISKI